MITDGFERGDFRPGFLQPSPNLELEADQNEIYGQPGQPALARPAYELDHAFSGHEGIEKTQGSIADGRPYQVAFVDVRMPDLDGVEPLSGFGRSTRVFKRLSAPPSPIIAGKTWLAALGKVTNCWS